MSFLWGDSTLWTALAAGYVLTWLLIPWVLLKPRTHSSGAVAWMFAIIFLPYVGPLLCLLLSTTRWERRSKRKQTASAHVNEQVPWPKRDVVVPYGDLGCWGSVARMLTNLTQANVLGGNDIEIIPDEKHSYDVMEEIIGDAQRWIHIEYYIFRTDEAGTRMRDSLIDKAKAGVQVRLLYDGFGSMLLTRNFLKPLEEAGVHVAPFTPGLKLWHMLTLNLRNHRKILVTDRQTAFTGGMNIGDEYIHKTDSFGEWRDMQVRLRGPVAMQFQQVFAQDWFYATGEELTDSRYYPDPEVCGETPAQVIADGPDNDVDTFYLLAVAALGQARERVSLTTPYFIPPEGLATALEAAARRGVHVRVMVSERGNFVWTLEAGRSYYDQLLAAGVEIHEYEKGMYHAKTLTVDGEWAFVGTPNWDFRSLILNFEVGASLYAPEAAERVERQFDLDSRGARRIDVDAWKKRPARTRLHEQFWRLFAPML